MCPFQPPCHPRVVMRSKEFRVCEWLDSRLPAYDSRICPQNCQKKQGAVKTPPIFTNRPLRRRLAWYRCPRKTTVNGWSALSSFLFVLLAFGVAACINPVGCLEDHAGQVVFSKSLKRLFMANGSLNLHRPVIAGPCKDPPAVALQMDLFLIVCMACMLSSHYVDPQAVSAQEFSILRKMWTRLFLIVVMDVMIYLVVGIWFSPKVIPKSFQNSGKTDSSAWRYPSYHSSKLI